MKEIECLIDLIPAKPTSENVKQIDILCKASIVLLSSHLEGFLQDLLEEFIEEVNQLSMGFKNLPLEFFVQHNFPKGHLHNNNFDTLVNLLNETRALEKINSAIKLNKKNFSITDSNPTPDTINKLFKAIGEENILDTLNEEILGIPVKIVPIPFLRDDEKKELIRDIGYPNIIEMLDDYLTQKRHGSGRKDRDVGFYNIVNRLLNFRNNIAHGNTGIRISTVDLIELKDLITKLAKALTEKAEQKISSLGPVSVDQLAPTNAS